MALDKDYDTPRTTDEDSKDESLEAVKGRQNPRRDGTADVEEDDTGEDFELPGADLSNGQLVVQIIPPGKDEFTCSSCFLVHHRSQIAAEDNGAFTCTECFDPSAGSRSAAQSPAPHTT